MEQVEVEETKDGKSQGTREEQIENSGIQKIDLSDSSVDCNVIKEGGRTSFSGLLLIKSCHCKVFVCNLQIKTFTCESGPAGNTEIVIGLNGEIGGGWRSGATLFQVNGVSFYLTPVAIHPHSTHLLLQLMPMLILIVEKQWSDRSSQSISFLNGVAHFQYVSLHLHLTSCWS